jgi:anti-anti-sigma factor
VVTPEPPAIVRFGFVSNGSETEFLLIVRLLYGAAYAPSGGYELGIIGDFCCFPIPFVLNITSSKFFYSCFKIAKQTRNMISDAEFEAASQAAKKHAVVQAGNYLNKLTGEKIERECRDLLREGCSDLVLDFSETELVNSIGVSILLGIIDTAEKTGTRVFFSEVNPETVELFDLLGVTKHVSILAD